MRDSFWMRVCKTAWRALGWARMAALRLRPAEPHIYRKLFLGDHDWHVLAGKFVESEENRTPDFEFYDLATTSMLPSARNRHTSQMDARHRFSERAEDGGIETVANPQDLLRRKTKFCAFMFRNYKCETRNRVFELLSRHRRVDSAGPLFSNQAEAAALRDQDAPAQRRAWRAARRAGPRHASLLQMGTQVGLYRPYKFVVAFENSLGLHYVSEKLSFALSAHTVPVYWGNPQIAAWFNPERFINAFDFDTLDSLVRHVLRVDEDDELYLRYVSQPIQTLQQAQLSLKNSQPRENFADLHRLLCDAREKFSALLDGEDGAFLRHYRRLLEGRALPLAQRRAFHRECLSRCARSACRSIAADRLILTGRQCAVYLPERRQQQTTMSERFFASRCHVWPHPAFYKVVDMHGRLGAED